MRIHDFCSRQKKIILTRRRLIKFTGGREGGGGRERESYRIIRFFESWVKKRGDSVVNGEEGHQRKAGLFLISIPGSDKSCA